MESKKMNERTLSFKMSRVITEDEIKQVAGAGANSPEGHYTNSATANGSYDRGHFDAKADVQWDF